jgi:hypothetical protein
MSKEEIKDLIEMNYENNINGIVDHIYNLESELIRTQEALDVARELILKNSVSKDRYNDIVKKYNALLKARK